MKTIVSAENTVREKLLQMLSFHPILALFTAIVGVPIFTLLLVAAFVTIAGFPLLWLLGLLPA